MLGWSQTGFNSERQIFPDDLLPRVILLIFHLQIAHEQIAIFPNCMYYWKLLTHSISKYFLVQNLLLKLPGLLQHWVFWGAMWAVLGCLVCWLQRKLWSLQSSSWSYVLCWRVITPRGHKQMWFPGMQLTSACATQMAAFTIRSINCVLPTFVFLPN